MSPRQRHPVMNRKCPSMIWSHQGWLLQAASSIARNIQALQLMELNLFDRYSGWTRPIWRKICQIVFAGSPDGPWSEFFLIGRLSAPWCSAAARPRPPRRAARRRKNRFCSPVKAEACDWTSSSTVLSSNAVWKCWTRSWRRSFMRSRTTLRAVRREWEKKEKEISLENVKGWKLKQMNWKSQAILQERMPTTRRKN